MLLIVTFAHVDLLCRKRDFERRRKGTVAQRLLLVSVGRILELSR